MLLPSFPVSCYPHVWLQLQLPSLTHFMLPELGISAVYTGNGKACTQLQLRPFCTELKEVSWGGKNKLPGNKKEVLLLMCMVCTSVQQSCLESTEKAITGPTAQHGVCCGPCLPAAVAAQALWWQGLSTEAAPVSHCTDTVRQGLPRFSFIQDQKY